MPKYRLLRDAPHGKAGSEWELYSDNPKFKDVGLRYPGSSSDSKIDSVVPFPRSTFSDWFSEIKEMPKFTKEQAETMKTQNNWITLSIGTNNQEQFLAVSPDWLDENTEK